MIGNYRGKRLFSGRLFAGQLFGPTLRDIVVSSGGGSVSRIRARQLREDDDLLLMLAGLVASGALS